MKRAECDFDAELAAQSASSQCFHCGLPLPSQAPWCVTIDSTVRPMCCPGCQAVAQGIVDNGFADYYATRDGFAVTAEALPPELALYDSPANARQFARDGTMCEAVLSIEAIRCAACVWLIERRIAQLPGVQDVAMNVATERLQVRWQADVTTPATIIRTLREIGYTATPFDPVRQDAQLERARKTLFRQLFIAGLAMMQVMMYALPVYLANDGSMDADMTGLMRWAGLLLTLPAVFYSARPFFAGAWRSVVNRVPGMDLPVSIGILAAFGASLVATLRGHGEIYFDSITMFVFLLLCSRYLELSARRKAATALNALQRALPAAALRMIDYPARRDTELIAAEQLQIGDVMLVRPGDALAADGILVEGVCAIDLSLLTGESLLQPRAIGAALPGGAVNATQPIVVRITRAAADSTLSALVRLVERAAQGKPQLALWADKVAGWFVSALLLLAVIVFVFWLIFDPPRAWPIAIAILVVSCPCALSLATPTALAAATDRLVQQGVLIVQPHVLETLHRATHVIFDKTGTLTLGKPVLQHLATFAGMAPDRCLQIAAALESSSAHPLAGAILAAAQRTDLSRFGTPVVSALEQVAGQGLAGMVDGVPYRLGSAAFVQAMTGNAASRAALPDTSAVFLGTGGALLARFDLADGLRDDAASVVERFQKAGKHVILLSGDRQTVAQGVARQLGIEHAVGDATPDGKLAFVQALQRDGAIVAMVGDGVNDAAVLRAADVSFAMGSGAALAQTHADCVLLSPRLSALSEVAATAAKTLQVVRQNLWWASAYNLIAIPAAAAGLLTPWISAIGMSVSSAVVVLNALRLRRATPLPPPVGSE